MNKNAIEIPFSKGKLLKFVLLSILFVLLGVWILLKQPQVDNPIFNNFILKNGAALLGVLMGMFGCYFFGRKILNPKAAIVIDEDGILILRQNEKILWKDITEIREWKEPLSGQKLIVVDVKNPEEYIAKEKRALKRKLLEDGLRRAGSPISFSCNALKIDHLDALNILNEKLESHKTV